MKYFTELQKAMTLVAEQPNIKIVGQYTNNPHKTHLCRLNNAIKHSKSHKNCIGLHTEPLKNKIKHQKPTNLQT